MNARFYLSAALLALTFAMTSCNSDEDGGSMNASNISLDPLETEVNEVSNMFAGRLLNAASAQAPDENQAFSPLSIQMALSMLANGADGDTYTELVSGLGFGGMNIESVNSYNEKLVKVLPTADKEVDLAIANSLWTGDAYPVYDEFISSCAKAFNANIGKVDFMDEKGTLETVNNWIADNTRGKITKVLDELIDPADEVFILANALYFKGTWTEKFNTANTRPASFINYDNSESKVEMMHGGKATHTYLDNKRFTCLSMPYGNGSFSFDILYPSCNNELLKKQQSVPDATINDAEEWLKSNTILAPSEIKDEATINMPKFSISSKFLANAILAKMGITKIFDTDNANLSKICDANCIVSQVVHGCNIAVDESGAEAAASTVVEGFVDMAQTAPIPFTIDHPFIYMIRENSTGAILFIGKMVKM